MPLDWSVVCTGGADFNGDGDSDILLRQSDGHIGMWQVRDFNLIATGYTSIASNPNDWVIASHHYQVL